MMFIYNMYLQIVINKHHKVLSAHASFPLNIPASLQNDNQSSHNNTLSNVHIQWIQNYTELFHKTLLIA